MFSDGYVQFYMYINEVHYGFTVMGLVIDEELSCCPYTQPVANTIL